MTLTAFLIRIVFLALPGIVASTIYRTLKGTGNNKDWEDFREIALFALLSYMLFGLVQYASNWLGLTHGTLTAVDAFLNEKIPPSYPEILLATFCGIILAFLASYIYTYKLVNKLGRRVGASRRHGDGDIWDYYQATRPQWVVVRDHKLNLTYYGWMELSSDSEKRRELLMRYVSVYSTFEKDKLLYERDTIYFSRDYYDLTIEAPNQSALTRKAHISKESSNDKPKPTS